MIEMRSNIGAVARGLRDRIKRITADSITREAAVTALAVSKRRIFEQGRKTNGSPIGTYSPGYLRTRARRNWANRNVTLEFTGQMRMDYTLIAIANGYGLGFMGGAAGTNATNATSSDKARFAEQRYGPVFPLTADEIALVQRIIQNRVNRIISGTA